MEEGYGRRTDTGCVLAIGMECGRHKAAMVQFMKICRSGGPNAALKVQEYFSHCWQVGVGM